LDDVFSAEESKELAQLEATLKRLEPQYKGLPQRIEEYRARADTMRDELFGHRFDLEALLALIDPTWTVGDLACGTGRASEALAPWVDRVLAVDGSSAMLDAARDRLDAYDNVTLREGELERLPLPDASLDAAFLFLALHHVSEPAVALAEARRVLRPGGRLLVLDMLPHTQEHFRAEMGHVWLGFDLERVDELLTDAGFSGARARSLRAAPEARGPGLFVAVGTADALPISTDEPTTASAGSSATRVSEAHTDIARAPIGAPVSSTV
ncbi:MAG: class I SAM-dependent methyltransferase, partial [Acidobacteriota bacterium]